MQSWRLACLGLFQEEGEHESQAAPGAVHAAADSAAAAPASPHWRTDERSRSGAARVRELSHFIDGQRAAGASGRFGEVFDPAQGRVAARVPLANAAEVATAVAAAKAAFPAWSETAPLKRARLMFKFKQLLDAHHDELAELITRDHGKLFSDAKGEVLRGIEIVEFACGIPNLLKTDFTEQIGGDIDNWNLRQPLGVVAGI